MKWGNFVMPLKNERLFVENNETMFRQFAEQRRLNAAFRMTYALL